MNKIEAQSQAALILVTRALNEVLVASIASCTCLTKTPDIAFHEHTCRYRCLTLVSDDLRAALVAISKINE